jgi:hypothetical protein
MAGKVIQTSNGVLKTVVLATPDIRPSKQRVAEIATLQVAYSTCVSQTT